MVITEVRIKLCEENNERLLAFCSVTFDNAFVVRDLKIIEGTKGMFVAMPSRKLTDRCGKCGESLAGAVLHRQMGTRTALLRCPAARHTSTLSTPAHAWTATATVSSTCSPFRCSSGTGCCR